MPEHDPLFVRLEPPPGGRTRLAARLDARPRPRRRVPLVIAAAVAAAVVLALLPGPDHDGSPIEAEPADPAMALVAGVSHPALAQWGRSDGPTEPVTAIPGDPDPPGLTRVATSSDAVVMYQVTVP